MRIVLHVLLGLIGLSLVVGTIGSAVRSTILPRSANSGLARFVSQVTRVLFRLRAGRAPSYERRDRIMALLGPIYLLNLLGSWLVLTLTGFTLIYLATGTATVTAAIELSGSSAFTLGTAIPRGLPTGLLTYLEAGIGLLLLTLLITYLPSIYGAFSRRENGVNLLRARAGDPPSSTTLLIRYYRIDGGQVRLGELWQTWERWFSDVEETHTTFAVLPYFRSPQPEQSWITAAGVLLDTASMWVAVVEHDIDPDAQLCIRTGFLTLRRVGTSLGIESNDDPQPDDPISVSRDEWDDAVRLLEEEGLPLRADRDQAWKAWRGWRVNYDTILLETARAVEAPVALWVSDRSPVGHRPRRRWWSPLGPGPAV
jgi:hypothetical protein